MSMPDQPSYSHNTIEFKYAKQLKELLIPRGKLLQLGKAGLLFMQVEFDKHPSTRGSDVTLADNMSGYTSFRYHEPYTDNAINSIPHDGNILRHAPLLEAFAACNVSFMAKAINGYYASIFEASAMQMEREETPLLYTHQALAVIGMSAHKLRSYAEDTPIAQRSREVFKGTPPSWSPENLANIYMWNIPGGSEVRDNVRLELSEQAMRHAVLLDVA